MGGQFGYKETGEVLTGVNEVSLVLIKGFRDGVQFSDFYDFYEHWKNNEEFKEKLKAAYENYNIVPDEVGELDAEDYVGLISIQLPYIPKLIDAIRGPDKEPE